MVTKAKAKRSTAEPNVDKTVDAELDETTVDKEEEDDADEEMEDESEDKPNGEEKKEPKEDKEDKDDKEAAEVATAGLDEQIDAMRDEEGHPPKEVHDWLSKVGAKGRATPPKRLGHFEKEA